MAGLDHAILGLVQALGRPRGHQIWCWLVRHRMAEVHDALSREHPRSADAWLTPRHTSLARERERLLEKLVQLGSQIGESADLAPLHAELLRLVSDLERHRQRLNDLVYDAVALELGGSE